MLLPSSTSAIARSVARQTGLHHRQRATAIFGTQVDRFRHGFHTTHGATDRLSTSNRFLVPHTLRSSPFSPLVHPSAVHARVFSTQPPKHPLQHYGGGRREEDAKPEEDPHRANDPLHTKTLRDENEHPNVPEDTQPKSGMTGKVGTAASALLVLSGKTKYLLAGLKLTKLSTMGSMFLTVGTYTMLFGWPYAVGLVGQIFLHEAGHAVAMRYYGIPSGPMVFIPFMGAAVEMKKNPSSAYVEAMVALAGPVAGGLAATGVLGAAYATESDLLFALANVGYFLNLLNLFPIGSLDGGRITGALSPWFLVGGLGAGAGAIYSGMITSPMVYLVMLMASFTTYERFYGSKAGNHDYYNISGQKKAAIGGSYLLLLALLLAGKELTDHLKKSPEELKVEMGTEFEEGSIGYRLVHAQEQLDAMDAEEEQEFVQFESGYERK